MGRVSIVRVETKSEENEFIKLPWKIYKEDSCWVPPIISEFRKTIRGENNMLSKSGTFALILAYKEGIPSGRLCVGINEHLNHAKNYKEGYISLFECIDDDDIARALFQYAEDWLRKRGMEKIIGPLSVPGGDDYRGLLIDNFVDPTLVMNTYNKEYYKRFFEDHGFIKYLDCYGYKVDICHGMDERYEKYIPYAMNKYHFKVDKLNLKNINKDMRDIKKIIDDAMPKEWEDFIPPTDEEIEIIANQLVPVADPDLIYIARTCDGRPIGFNVALPDYNEILRKMNGRLFPFGFLRFLFDKRKISRTRFFVLFVIPEYRKKGVSAAIYRNVYRAAVDKGYKYGEGSTIWEYNEVMMRDIERFGGIKYKTYRIYKKGIND
jgi:GNAT superfamily N-acetyltransferase